jgi:hypothetical protein
VEGPSRKDVPRRTIERAPGKSPQEGKGGDMPSPTKLRTKQRPTPEHIQPFNERQRNKIQARNHSLKARYAITPEQYAGLMITANHCCQACGRHKSEVKLCVDHSHKTGQVRGILCNSCNVALGHLRDDIEVIESLLVYAKARCYDRGS